MKRHSITFFCRNSLPNTTLVLTLYPVERIAKKGMKPPPPPNPACMPNYMMIAIKHNCGESTQRRVIDNDR